MSQVVHIEAPGQTDEQLVYAMLCGEQCMIFDDGEPIPEGFDFVDFNHPGGSDCEPCRQALRARQAPRVAALVVG